MTIASLSLLQEMRHWILDGRDEFHLFAIGTEASNPEDRTATAEPDAEIFTCQVCGKADVEASMMRHHIGAHLLQPDWSMYDKTKPATPCGLCGLRTSIGQHLVDPSIGEGCPVSLKKQGTATRAVHQCKQVGDGPKYSLGAAGNCSLGAPCTNRPIACPIPGCQLVVWSYSLGTHYSTHHPNVPFGDEAHREVALGVHVECMRLIGLCTC